VEGEREEMKGEVRQKRTSGNFLKKIWLNTSRKKLIPVEREQRGERKGRSREGEEEREKG
jgi:hypothetical protein